MLVANSMALSIVIPCLNEGQGLQRLLLRLQSLRSDVELIVVDGGSSDDSVALAEPWVDQVIVSPTGRARQMNAGAAVAQYDTLLFLHADTFLPDQAPALIQKAITEGARWGRFDVRLLGQHVMLPLIAFLMNWRSALTGITTGDQALFIEKSLFCQLGGFPDQALMEDIAFSRRLKRLSWPYRIRQKAETSARRWMAFGVFKTICLMWWCRFLYFVGVQPNYLNSLYRRGQFWIR